jgi:hypothetical protein
MIVLNTEKEIVRIHEWGDITERPGYSGDLDPGEHELKSIIGRYAFPEKVPCGLSNCHTPHNKGYIVVTKDGQETNIGKDCGKTYFGVDFETLSNKFDRDMTEKENREKLWTFYWKLEEIHAQVNALRGSDLGGDWVYKQITALQNLRDVQGKITRTLNRMAKARDPRLTRAREATENEIEQARQAGQRIERPYYITEVVGELAGLEALYPENNLKSMLVDEVPVKLKEFAEVNVDALSYEGLSKWSKWFGGLDATFDRSGQAIRSGRALLTQKNLTPLADAAELNTEELDTFTRHLKQLPAN